VNVKHLTLGYFLAIAAAVAGLSTNGRAAEEPPGERLYVVHCKRCHGEQGRGGQGPVLVPLKWSEEKVLDLLRYPECEMPAFSESDLSDAQVTQIVASLKAVK
jgi:mono/diheme cytochrome c family protein